MENDKSRQGISRATLDAYLSEIKEIRKQLDELKRWLAESYQEDCLKSINPVDLDARRRSTASSIERLEGRLAAIVEALRKQPGRSWTDKGDFSHVQNTGVTFNAK